LNLLNGAPPTRWLGESAVRVQGILFRVEKLVIKPVVVVIGNHRLGFDLVSAVVQADFVGEPGHGVILASAFVTRRLSNGDGQKEKPF